MAIRPDWNIGTITLNAGSADFTTLNAMLNMSAIEPGDVIITPSGHILVIKEILSASSGTLMLPCPVGAAGVDLPLRIRFQPDGSRVAGALRAAAALLTGSNVEALAGLMGQAGKIPMFTGAGTMTLADASDFETDLTGIEDAIDTLGLNVADLSSGLEASNVNVGLLFDGLNDAETQIAANADAIYASNQAISTNADAIGDLNSGKLDKPTGTVAQFLRGDASPQSVVGTVTQAAGGAIIQRGSNANGEFVRFADGTQICWGVIDVIPTPNQVTGQSFAFPSSFSTSPVITVNANSSVIGTTVQGAAVGGANNNGAVAYLLRTNSTGTGIHYIAIGRWF